MTGGPGNSHCCLSSFLSQITSLLRCGRQTLNIPSSVKPSRAFTHTSIVWKGSVMGEAGNQRTGSAAPHEMTENILTTLQQFCTGRDIFSSSSTCWEVKLALFVVFSKSNVKPYLQWCSPGIRGTGLWQSAAPSWTFPLPIHPAAPA